MGELTFMDSTGIRTLVQFEHAGNRVEICDASDAVTAVLRIAGLTELLPPGASHSEST